MFILKNLCRTSAWCEKKLYGLHVEFVLYILHAPFDRRILYFGDTSNTQYNMKFS